MYSFNSEIRIATRSSPLAIKQCEILIEKLPSIKTKIIQIVSRGDEIQDKSLREIGGKGLFIKKLEQALIDNVADIAVHSLKDMEWKETKGLEIAAFLQRGSRKDILISKYKSIYELPKNAKLGTSSVRRKAFILSERPDLNISILRGNINTRINKYNSGKFDGIVLAQAGVERLDIKTKYTEFDESIMLPSAGQGAIAVQCRSNNKQILNLIRSLNHEQTKYETLAERSFVFNLNGTCSSPIGASAKISNEILELYGALASPDGALITKNNISGFYKDAEKLGKDLAIKIINQMK